MFLSAELLLVQRCSEMFPPKSFWIFHLQDNPPWPRLSKDHGEFGCTLGEAGRGWGDPTVRRTFGARMVLLEVFGFINKHLYSNDYCSWFVDCWTWFTLGFGFAISKFGAFQPNARVTYRSPIAMPPWPAASDPTQNASKRLPRDPGKTFGGFGVWGDFDTLCLKVVGSD